MVGNPIFYHWLARIRDEPDRCACLRRSLPTHARQPNVHLPPPHFAGVRKRPRRCDAESIAQSHSLAGIVSCGAWLGDGSCWVFSER